MGDMWDKCNRSAFAILSKNGGLFGIMTLLRPGFLLLSPLQYIGLLGSLRLVH